MGSIVEINDTLQITKEQGFPEALVIQKHLKEPFRTEDFKDLVFEFKNKPGVRVYHMPPVRVFLAENLEGKWIYWGLVEVIETTLDNVRKTTSGKFKITYIYNPEEMKNAFKLIDRRVQESYFN